MISKYQLYLKAINITQSQKWKKVLPLGFFQQSPNIYFTTKWLSQGHYSLMLPVVTFNQQIISVILTHLTCSLSRCLPSLRSLDLNLVKKHHRLQIRFILSMPGNEKHRLLFYLNHQAGTDSNPFSIQEAQAILTQCNLSSPTGNSAMQFQQRDVTQVQLQPKTPNILLVYHGKLWSPKT